MSEDRVVSPIENNSDKNFDLSLRPKSFSEYIGQENIKTNLQITIKAASKRSEPIDHVLFYGAPGLGKTTLANVVSNEIGANLKVTSGPAIERSGDLATILTNLSDGDILFIDEIHRLNKVVEEILYPAMEDFALDLIMGKGSGARTLRIDLPRFTIIGATTKASLLSAPLRDRFGIIHHLDFYEDEHIHQIIKRSSNILGVEIDEEASLLIAERARKTPRIANRLLKRVRDFSVVEGNGFIDKDICLKSFEVLNIDKYGLDHVDRKILNTIIEKFGGGPVGLNTLSAATGEDMATIEDVYEPYLMQLGFLDRSPRGRVATDSAFGHLGLKKQ
ncbi:Holliday junction branch migration DNA helicase RuvB [Candidatus Falkowbacteria bacterium HGW-Falkowbacteria-1]|uniref:Holliday junction branch migration complex subunit RuvB n=1 Tax=Candidatus Falkowbacteria bacterium HGW-Falkowbacteria-1 TaxID=2013768 RepID=A0A2N2EAH3_9BACT|nr:MAG: Holliday junction branch migration DNA helicase RuvB [Candidatus Falkowbacteria bacterium HGW-Falkowbacteria-1]